MNDMMEQAKETFISESMDLLQEMELSLNLLGDQPADEELINSVFRAAHTIKGSAGLFGFDNIVSFTHQVENVLDQVRAGKVMVQPPLIEILLECRDHTELLIEQIGESENPGIATQSAALIAQLQQQAHPEPSAAVDSTPRSAEPPATYQPQIGREESGSVESDNWHISLQFSPDLLRNGMDPLSFLRYLASLGEIVNVVTLVDSMPSAAEMDPECCYLGMEIAFNGDTDKKTLIEVFEFIAEDSLVSVMPPNSKVSEYAELLTKLIESRGNDSTRIGDLLIEVGALTQRELDQALKFQSKQPEGASRQPLGEVLVEQHSVHPSTVKVALDKQKKIQERRTNESRSIRVDSERLDQLINLVGELVIAGAGTSLKAQQRGDEELLESVSLISRLVEDIRDRSLRLRMVQIGETFSRFNRVVRDVAKDLDKSITLEIQGAETELDKSVVEKIGDPLTHLVRNSIDHGIESAEQRLAAGKPEKGTVRLNAFHDSGSIVIEVSDDGGGIDTAKVHAKAIANGLVSPDQQLSRSEILRLILEAGLSTKAAVSNLSGRGVGMDVVKRNVEALRGSIDVDSELGRGTSIRIRLPLTLSIIGGFLVEVGSASYVIPLDSVVECIEHDETAEVVREHGGRYVSLRGEVLPFLDLRELFGETARQGERENIVVVHCAGQKAGLVVDALMGEYQTVIKPLSQIFSRLSGISGSTILGSGEVAMILDVSSLIREAEQKTLQLS